MIEFSRRTDRRAFYKKKHISQMTKKEVLILKRRLSVLDGSKIHLTRHAINQINSKNLRLNKSDIIDMIYDSEIIEYKLEFDSQYNLVNESILLRSNKSWQNGINVCMVLGMRNYGIITVWGNRINDNHETIDMTYYNKNVKIIA